MKILWVSKEIISHQTRPIYNLELIFFKKLMVTNLLAHNMEHTMYFTAALCILKNECKFQFPSMWSVINVHLFYCESFLFALLGLFLSIDVIDQEGPLDLAAIVIHTWVKRVWFQVSKSTLMLFRKTRSPDRWVRNNSLQDLLWKAVRSCWLRQFVIIAFREEKMIPRKLNNVKRCYFRVREIIHLETSA